MRVLPISPEPPKPEISWVVTRVPAIFPRGRSVGREGAERAVQSLSLDPLEQGDCRSVLFPPPPLPPPPGGFLQLFSSKLDSSCEEIKFLLPPPFSSFPFHSQVLFLRRHRHVPYVSPPTPHFGFIPLLSRMMRDGSRGDRSRKKSKGIGEKKSSPAECCTEFNPPLPVPHRAGVNLYRREFSSVFARDVTPSRSGNTKKRRGTHFPLSFFSGA